MRVILLGLLLLTMGCATAPRRATERTPLDERSINPMDGIECSIISLQGYCFAACGDGKVRFSIAPCDTRTGGISI